MDSLTLRGAVAEINRHRGTRVAAVRAPGDWELNLVLEGGVVLVLSAGPEHNTLYATRTEPRPASETHFGRAVETALARSRFVEAVQRGLDRVVSLGFEARDRLGDVRPRRLIAELTGKGANVYLVEGDAPFAGRIRARLRSADGRTPGADYAPPPVEKPDVTTAAPGDLADAAARALSDEGARPRALVAAWAGTSPATAREVWLRAETGTEVETAGAGARTEAAPKEAPSPSRLVETWMSFFAETRPQMETEPPGSLFSPTLAVFRGDRREALCFAPRQPVLSAEPCPSVSRAAETAHREALDYAASGRKSPRRRAVLQAEQRVRNALEAREREAADAPDPESLRRKGEALLASAHTIRTGMAEATIPDPRTDETVTIKLNPKLSPAENADLYFKRARKAQRRGGGADGRNAELRERLDGLGRLRERLDAAGDGEPDAAWFRDARALGVKLPAGDQDRGPDAGPEDRLPSALRPRRYTLSGGWEVLVGKSNRGNEVLTHEIARPGDLWLHADQASGSHAVLRHHEKGKEAPQSVLLAAAAIAAWFSKARHAAKVPVLVTRKRFVRRIRKAPLGTVGVGEHKTVMVTPSNPDDTKDAS
jgi:predicted ribosome quality control (RQC) complex YloA/Tae2 family protein